MEKQEDEKSISMFSDIEIPVENKNEKLINDKQDYGDEIPMFKIESDPLQDSYNEHLNNIKTPFHLDILKFASDAFDIYINDVKKSKINKIDLYEIRNLLDVIGIKKNEFEVTNKIIELKSENPKKFRDDKYSKECFLDVVAAFRNYRIDEKLLVAFYRAIDKEEDGTVGIFDLKRISAEKKLNFTDEEIYEILEFFEMEERVKNSNPKPKEGEEESEKYFLTFEKFCKIYYQG